MENWHVVMYNGMRSSAGPFSCIYFIAWIFIGNFVLLNLFLAILLDAYTKNNKKEVEKSGPNFLHSNAGNIAELMHKFQTMHGKPNSPNKKWGKQEA